MLPNEFASGAGGAKQLRRAANSGKHRLLPLAGKIILLILRKLAGNLLQSKHAAGYGLVHGPGVLKMGKELLFPIGKGGDCVHGRPPFPYIKDGFIVPVCAGFVN